MPVNAIALTGRNLLAAAAVASAATAIGWTIAISASGDEGVPAARSFSAVDRTVDIGRLSTVAPPPALRRQGKPAARKPAAPRAAARRPAAAPRRRVAPPAASARPPARVTPPPAAVTPPPAAVQPPAPVAPPAPEPETPGGEFTVGGET